MYRLARGNWKISCHRWNMPLFWSFCPTDIPWIVLVFTCLWPRPWRNYKHKYTDKDVPFTTKLHLQPDKSFLIEMTPTCSVLIHDLMSLSVFSQSDSRVPESAFIPWQTEICKQQTETWSKPRLLMVSYVRLLLCVRVCVYLCQSLCQAGGLSLGESQEEGLLPQRSESWNITEQRDKQMNCKSHSTERQFIHFTPSCWGLE